MGEYNIKYLEGKCVVLGVTGGIAAYKMPNVASMLKKLGAKVRVIMTENATKFITPLTFETITENKCLVDTFDRNFQYDVKHISVAKEADIILISPATANIIGKISNGIADDMLSTVVLAAKCKKILAPSMNTAMLENPIVQDNIKKLKKYGIEIIEPETGLLACKDVGKGKMPEPEVLVSYILKHLARKKDMDGINVTVTAGPTREAIDPVRYITNHSTGKMGYSIAKEAMYRGANVTLISGHVSIPPIDNVNMVYIESAKEMFEAVKCQLPNTDILIKAAAVADYRPSNISEDKIKKTNDDMSIQLERTDDILEYVKYHKSKDTFICGFSMETKDMIQNSKNKLEKKDLDMIVANNLKVTGAGFGVDTNVVTLITKDDVNELSIMSKEEVSSVILSEIIKLKNK